MTLLLTEWLQGRRFSAQLMPDGRCGLNMLYAGGRFRQDFNVVCKANLVGSTGCVCPDQQPLQILEPLLCCISLPRCTIAKQAVSDDGSIMLSLDLGIQGLCSAQYVNRLDNLCNFLCGPEKCQAIVAYADYT